MTTVTAREFNQNASAAKRAADNGIVFVTDRGVASHVLMSIAEYERLRGKKSLLDALTMHNGGDIDFEPETSTFTARVPDL